MWNGRSREWNHPLMIEDDFPVAAESAQRL
jgi:hypothetical protein